MSQDEVKVILSCRDEVTAKLKGVGKEVSAFGQTFKTVLNPAVLLTTLGLGGLVVGIKKVIDAAAEAEKAEAQLTAALVQTGQYSPATVEALGEIAAATQALTVYDDDAIAAIEGLLLRFGVMPDQMAPAIRAVTNMAAALGIELHAAAMLVARAAGGSTAMLGRYGIHLDDARLKAEGLGYVLGALNEKFGGAAQAQASTFAGRMAQLRNAFDNLKAAIGDLITRQGALGGLFELLIDGIVALTEAIKSSQSSITIWANTFVASLLDLGMGLVNLLAIWKMVRGGMSINREAYQREVDQLYAIYTRLEAVKNDLGEMAGTQFPAFRGAGVKAFEDTGTAIDAAAELVHKRWMEMVKEGYNITREWQTLVAEPMALRTVEVTQTAVKQVIDFDVRMVMEAAEVIKQTVDQTASTLADLMLGVRRDWGKAFADILRDFGRMIIQMLVKALLLKALKSIFGGPVGGLLGEGGIVGAPGVPNLQAGGTVVRRETVFVAGERGPEAVIPLHKLPELVSEIEKRRGRRAANITLNINPTQLDRLFELAPASVRSRIYESTLPGSRYEDSRR